MIVTVLANDVLMLAPDVIGLWVSVTTSENV